MTPLVSMRSGDREVFTYRRRNLNGRCSKVYDWWRWRWVRMMTLAIWPVFLPVLCEWITATGRRCICVWFHYNWLVHSVPKGRPGQRCKFFWILHGFLNFQEQFCCFSQLLSLHFAWKKLHFVDNLTCRWVYCRYILPFFLHDHVLHLSIVLFHLIELFETADFVYNFV